MGQRYVQVRKQQAAAVAQSIGLKNQADMASFNASQVCQSTAFRKVLTLFQGDVPKMLEYMKVRAMRDHPAGNSIIGISDDVAASDVANVESTPADRKLAI